MVTIFHLKFLGITFDNRMTFTKHFEEILGRCNHKFHRLRILVNKKWDPSPTTILQIYKQCVIPVFEYGTVFTITVSESIINKIQKVQNSFIRLALRLPKYVLARLIHEALGFHYLHRSFTSDTSQFHSYWIIEPKVHQNTNKIVAWAAQNGVRAVQ